jgi:hypothetical protein
MGIELQGLLVAGEAAPEVAVVEAGEAQAAMGLEIRRRQGDARLGEGEGLPDDLFCPRRPGGEGGLDQDIGEGAIGAGEFPIQLDRLPPLPLGRGGPGG